MDIHKTFLILFTLLPFFNSQGQDFIDNYAIGNYFDLGQQHIDGYYDFNYEPEKSLNVSYTIGEDYTPGYYYTRDGLKREGLLLYSQRNTFFKFKPSKNERETTIKPDECNGYVIGADSFAVIENFYVQRLVGAFHSDKREFAEVIDKVENLTFYKHTRAGSQNIIDTYLVKADTSAEYISFAKGPEKFKEVAVEIFGDIEFLKVSILKNEYIDEDIPVLIKILKYKSYYDQHRKICFNTSWDETDDSRECAYYAEIETIEDSVFHLIYYFKNGIKIYEGDFTSFYPNKKRGEFVFYYPNGSVRKKIVYKYNEPKSGTDYFPNGSIHREFLYRDQEIIYKQVNDAKGSNCLSEFGNGKEVFYDSINNREINYAYTVHALSDVYYVDSTGKKIFQLCEKNAKLKGYKTLRFSINDEIKYPIQSVKDFNHGYVLIKCLVEPTGFISDMQIIKSVDSNCNTAVLKFMTSLNRYKNWRPAKSDGIAVAQEVVIPVDFSIKGFSRYRNHYNNMWMQQNMMMQQQMMKPPPPPQIPKYNF